MKPFEHNPRKLTKKKARRLEDTLARLGDLSGVVHELNTGQVAGGHQRLRVMFGEDAGEFRVKDGDIEYVTRFEKPDPQGTVAQGFILWRGYRYAYRETRWNDEDFKEANIAANVGAGTWDWEELANTFDAPDLMEWGFDSETLADWKRDVGALGNLLGSEEPAESADAEPQVDKASELQEKWQVQPGELFEIGDHRLICGDCTDGATVERLMRGEKADFCFTDPPYNVGVKYGNSTDDNQKKHDFFDWCKKWAVFLPKRHLLTVGIKRLLWWDEILGDPQWIIAWVKRNGQGQTGLGGTNKWDAIICYGVDQDHKTDMIELNNDYSEGVKADGLHPTAKPVELWKQVIERFNGRVIYEPFLGSGTTMVASQNLSRRCYGCEIEPVYCAVILERMTTAFPDLPVTRYPAAGA